MNSGPVRRKFATGLGESSTMLAFLIALRDALIALALGWVGVTVEARTGADNRCAGEHCDVRDVR